MLGIFLTMTIATAISPEPAPSPEPKTIITVKTNPLCFVLRNNVAQSIVGLRADDRLLDQGELLMRKHEFDATHVRSIAATGGASAAAQMDVYKMNELAGSMVKNLEKLDGLVADQRFSTDATDDSENARLLRDTKARLQAVIVEQRAALNIIEDAVETNMANDLSSRCDPVTCAGPKSLPTPHRLDRDVDLRGEAIVEQERERTLSEIIFADVEKCKG